MAGGFRLNGQNIDGDGGGEANTASLILNLTKDSVRFNKCAVEMRWVFTQESHSLIGEICLIMANRQVEVGTRLPPSIEGVTQLIIYMT